jgi:hypothetical protein
MARHVRCYLFGQNGIKHLSRRVIADWHAGQPALQYAGTTQKIAEVFVESVNRQPQEIISARGFYYTFDQQGRLTEVQPPPQTWGLSDDDLALVSHDIWGTRMPHGDAQSAERPALRPPADNAAVRQCMDAISRVVKQIYLRLAELTEAELHALSIDARALSETMLDDPITRGVAELAERHCGYLMRHRTGYGAWIAAIVATQWTEDRRRSSKISTLAWEKCASRDEAVAAARGLLAQYAKHFTHRVNVEPAIFSELEWQTGKRA